MAPGHYAGTEGGSTKSRSRYQLEETEEGYVHGCTPCLVSLNLTSQWHRGNARVSRSLSNTTVERALPRK